MRRKDRAMPESFAYEVVDHCQWAALSMTEPEGAPYCIPVSIVRDGNTVYFHSAKEGLKNRCLEHRGEVCLCCVGTVYQPPHEFTTKFTSAVLRGKASRVSEEKEQVHALRLLCEKYTPDHMEHFEGVIVKSLSATAVWKIEISEISGKRNQ